MGYQNPGYGYDLGGNRIEAVDNEKDLGVMVDEHLNFHAHTAMACKKANGILARIRRTFHHKDRDIVKQLYTGLVRPILEYGIIIWHPRYKMDRIEVEKVQRRATRLVPALKHLNYEMRLRAMGLPSMEYRMRRGDLIQAFKIYHGLDRVDRDEFFKPATHEHGTRGHQHRLFKTRAELDVRRNAFSHRIVNDWNGLPAEVVEAPTVNTFKNRLDKWLAPDKYKSPFSNV